MSSMGYTGKTTNWTEDYVGNQAQRTIEEHWGPIDGEIIAYDPAAGTATVKPLYKPLFNGEPVDMPNLLEVPVEMPRSANAATTYGNLVGSKVRLTPQMRSSEKYDTENDGAPSDARAFHLSDMKASLIGGDSLTDPLPNVDPDNYHARFDKDGNFGLRGSPDGKVRLDGAQGNIYDLLAQVVELLASDQLHINYGSSAGEGHRLQNQAQYAEIAGKLRAMAL